MLSDEEIDVAHVKFAWVNLNCTEHRDAFARAIESAATAPLLARIAELERELEEARKDAERRLDLVERVRKYPVNVDYKGSLLWADILREVDRAAIKEQTK